nr:RAMP superfamily CRISPR-associated protein [uncultured Rhodopila sp.]
MIEYDDTLLFPVRHVLRIVLQTATPLSIASGDANPDHDVSLFRDWNGLPCLSGTCVAGVLRALHEDYAGWFNAGSTAAVFGFAGHRVDTGRASRLMVSFGLVHDAADRPVDGFRAPEAIASDPVLRLLASAAPILRDHVAIDGRGVAREGLKFDRSACPVGVRFSLDLAIDGEADHIAEDAKLLRDIARLFAVPYARFGGAGRRGLGRLAVAREADGAPRAYAAAIDRRGSAGRDAWRRFRAADAGHVDSALFTALTAEEVEPPPASFSRRHPVSATLRLQPKGFWRMGQGDISWTAGHVPNQMPLTEPVILWPNGKARIVERDVTPVPGAGIKGALVHRAEFHLRRLRGRFGTVAPEHGREADCLFGAVRDAASGSAGALLIDDAWLDFTNVEAKAANRNRTSIDRHTGGVRLQVLFSDQALWREKTLTLSLTLLLRHPIKNPLVPLPVEAVRALDWAIEDLCEGRLAIGAHESGGDGVMERGELIMDDPATASFSDAHTALAKAATA